MRRRHRAEIPVRGYVFVVTTKRGRAPESYTVFDAHGRQVGCAQVRAGLFEVRHRTKRGRVLIAWLLFGGGDRFVNQDARRWWLAEAARAFKREADRAGQHGGKRWGRLRLRGRTAAN